MRFYCTEEIELKRKATESLNPQKAIEDFHFWMDNTAVGSFDNLLDIHRRMEEAMEITRLYLEVNEPYRALQCAKEYGLPDGHGIAGPFSNKMYVVKRDDNGKIYGFDVKE